MDDSLDSNINKRSAISRIGICLLNIFHPGLGLIRLAKYGQGGSFFAFTIFIFSVILTMYAMFPEMTYPYFIFICIFIIIGTIITCGGSIYLSWRMSAEMLPRQGKLWGWYSLIIIGVLISILSSKFLDLAQSRYRNFYASSTSMAPTLDAGDRFIAMLRDIRPVSRGDVVIVQSGDQEYVKRIVGIPGDTVAVRSGVVVLNSRPVKLDRVDEAIRDQGNGPITVIRYREQLPGEASSHEIFDSGPYAQDDWAAVTLGDGQYFVLGDNRDNSADSRFERDEFGLGIVDRDSINGRVLFRYWRKGIGLGQGKI